MKKWAVVALLIASSVLAFAGANEPGKPATEPVAPMVQTQQHDSHLEGEERFRTNCGRCHQVPHKFPPRMMATIVRHMRVRAMLTDKDMKTILAYMTE